MHHKVFGKEGMERMREGVGGWQKPHAGQYGKGGGTSVCSGEEWRGPCLIARTPLLEGRPEMFQLGNGSGAGEHEDFP